MTGIQILHHSLSKPEISVNKSLLIQIFLFLSGGSRGANRADARALHTRLRAGVLLVMPFLLAMVVTMAWLPVFGGWPPMAHRGYIPASARSTRADTAHRRSCHGDRGAIAALLVIPIAAPDRYFLIAAGVLTLFGGLDDRFNLDHRLKILGQVIAAAIVMSGVTSRFTASPSRIGCFFRNGFGSAHVPVLGRHHQCHQSRGRTRRARRRDDVSMPVRARDAGLQQRSRLLRGAGAGVRRSGAWILAVQHLSGQRLHGRRREPAARFRGRRVEPACDPGRQQRRERRHADSAACAADPGHA